jgi:2-keto-3-deoxy-L-rhamnonate aldolase RhmA
MGYPNIREKLRNGELVLGQMVFEFFTPGLTQIMANAGAEFVILDTEHSGVGIETLKSQAAYARGTGLFPLARVPTSHYHLIAPVLDAGIMGIMVPMVESAEQAASIASACRYRPQGKRGLAFGMAHDHYTGGDHVPKMKEANERTVVMVIIETAKGVENVDAIVGTPGIDVAWIGHYDLTNALGIDGQFDHPAYHAAVKAMLTACAKHGKAAGMLYGDVESGRKYVEQGFRMLSYSTDTWLYGKALDAGIAGLASARPAPKAPPKKKR